jgi:hypothetical protein
MSKTGWCFECRTQNIEVNWHAESKRFYCNNCWVRDGQPGNHPEAVVRTSGWPSREDHFKLRDGLYGVHLSDDIRVGEPFMVRCPKCGVIASGLTLPQGRIVVQEHLDVHADRPGDRPGAEDQEPTVQQEEEPHAEISLEELDLLMSGMFK